MSWIELYDEHGRLLGRRPADALPCTIGADASNALVSRAVGVAARHAELTLAPDGRLLVRSLGSEAGLRLGPGEPRLEEAELTPERDVLLGESRLRLVATGAPPDVVTASSAEVRPWHDRRRVKLAAPLALFVLTALVGWLISTEERPVVEALAVGAAVVTVQTVWAGGWALANRLKFGRARFGQHMAVAAVGTAAGLVLGELASWADYLQPDGLFAPAVAFVCLTALSLIVLRLHLAVMLPGGTGRVLRRTTAALALAFGGCMAWGPRLGNGDFTTDAEYAVQLKPLPASLLPSHDTTAFAFEIRELQQELLADRDSLTPP